MATMLIERQLRWYPTDSATDAGHHGNKRMSAEWPQPLCTSRNVVSQQQRKQCPRELRRSVSDEHLAVERYRHDGPGVSKPQHHLGGLQLPVIATSPAGGLKQSTLKDARTADRAAAAMRKTTTKMADVRKPAAKPVAAKTFEKRCSDSLSTSCPDLVRSGRCRDDDVIQGGGLNWLTPHSSGSPLLRNSSTVCLPSVQRQQLSRNTIQTQTTTTAREGKQQSQTTHAIRDRESPLRLSARQRQRQQHARGKTLLTASNIKDNTNSNHAPSGGQQMSKSPDRSRHQQIGKSCATAARTEGILSHSDTRNGTTLLPTSSQQLSPCGKAGARCKTNRNQQQLNRAKAPAAAPVVQPSKADNTRADDKGRNKKQTTERNDKKFNITATEDDSELEDDVFEQSEEVRCN